MIRKFFEQSRVLALLLSVLAFAGGFAHGQKTNRPAEGKTAAPGMISERNVRAQMEFLASDAMQGRGSMTPFELVACQYAAAQFRQFGVEPAGDAGADGKRGYVQTVRVTRNSFAEAPRLSYSSGGASTVLEHGKEMLVLQMNTAAVRGNLQKMTFDETPRPGAAVLVRLLEGETAQTIFERARQILDGGAVAVLVEELPAFRARWAAQGARPVSFSQTANVPPKNSNIIVLSRAAAQALNQVADNTPLEINGKTSAPTKMQTCNAAGVLPGGDAKLAKEAVLLSAHIDHLGVRQNAPGDDKIFNGADDDASGTTAVLELARVMGAGKKPKRTVYFVLFGSEEAGGYGSQFFVETFASPLENLIANLQFEMIGRPDAKVAAEELWLTGYDRSNLGAELARQGARLVADPHPEENFFQRSDNYTLARRGVVAHTVSSFGLHRDYHQASDEIETIDFAHMTRAINSLVKPVNWLVNSDFKPAWLPGKKP